MCHTLGLQPPPEKMVGVDLGGLTTLGIHTSPKGFGHYSTCTILCPVSDVLRDSIGAT